MSGDAWLDEFLQGRNPTYPGAGAAARSDAIVQKRLTAIRGDTTPPEKRLADNMLDINPAATDSLVQLMWGALCPAAKAAC